MPPLWEYMDDQATSEKGKNSKKKRFKLTRQLVRLALNDGWTQKEIAETCRTQQSIVSAWSKGQALGTEAQFLPLLDIYGHKLRRNSARVYWSVDSETQAKTFYRVEGKVVLSQAFFDLQRDPRGKLIKKIPCSKLVVHHQGSDNFRVIAQSRIKFTSTSNFLDCSLEDAIWSSQVLDVVTMVELLGFIDRFAQEMLQTYPSDANTLPFLLRQSLINHGFTVPDVVEYPAVW
jgi:hypothetical protein